MTSPWVVIVMLLAAVAGIWAAGHYLRLWLQAWASGTRIGLLPLMLMPLRNVDPHVIVRCKVMAAQAGLCEIPTSVVEAQYLAGGDVHRVTLALIAAQRSGQALDWDTAAAIDLAGRDVLEAVQVSVNTKVIHCPDAATHGASALSGVARDGIQVHVRARVTVRTNLSQLIGGATEATIIARVGQGIVAAIGACNTYREALTDPRLISRQVTADGLDAHTIFAIVSIDIAEIAVGANVGARLQIDQAEADLRVARANAEQRRTMAIARLQEMHAATRANEAAVVLAEAAIPTAIAQSLADGLVHVRPLRTGCRRKLTEQPQRRIG